MINHSQTQLVPIKLSLLLKTTEYIMLNDIKNHRESKFKDRAKRIGVSCNQARLVVENLIRMDLVTKLERARYRLKIHPNQVY